MKTRQPLLFEAEEFLARGACALGVQLDPGQIDAFRRYREELTRWSVRTNLTALRDPEEIVREGFLDSLACLPFVPPETARVLDIGSGAGFPALPLKLVRPDIQVTLVEASRKKTTFLRHIIRSLDIHGVRVEQRRAEDLADDPAEQGGYDLAFARAVAPLPEQAQLVAPFLRSGGLFLAQVGLETTRLDLGAGSAREEFEIAGEFALPRILARPGRRVLRLRRLRGRPAA